MTPPFSSIYRNTDMLALLWGTTIGYLSLTPLTEPPPLPGGDKLHHLGAYALLAFLGTLNRNSLAGVARTAFIVLIYGSAIEIVQPYVNRHMELGDMLANAGGVLCGILLAVAVQRLASAAD